MAERRKQVIRQCVYTPQRVNEFVEVVGLVIGQFAVVRDEYCNWQLVHVASGRILLGCSSALTGARLAQLIEARGFDFDAYALAADKETGLPEFLFSPEFAVMNKAAHDEYRFLCNWLEERDPEEPLY